MPGNVRGDVRHFAWLQPPPFRLLLWAEIDGVVCHPGNAPLRLHCATMFSRELILSLFVAGAVLCAASEVWKCDFRGRRKDS